MKQYLVSYHTTPPNSGIDYFQASGVYLMGESETELAERLHKQGGFIVKLSDGKIFGDKTISRFIPFHCVLFIQEHS